MKKISTLLFTAILFSNFQSLFSMEDNDNLKSIQQRLLQSEQELTTIRAQQDEHATHSEKVDLQLWDEYTKFRKHKEKTKEQLDKVKNSLEERYEKTKLQTAKIRTELNNSQAQQIISYSLETVAVNAPTLKNFMSEHYCLRCPEIQTAIAEFLGKSVYYSLDSTIIFKPYYSRLPGHFFPFSSLQFSEDNTTLFAYHSHGQKWGNKVYQGYKIISLKKENQEIRNFADWQFPICCVDHAKIDTFVSCESKDGKWAAITDNSGYEDPHNFPRELKVKIYKKESVNVLAYILGLKVRKNAS